MKYQVKNDAENIVPCLNSILRTVCIKMLLFPLLPNDNDMYLYRFEFFTQFFRLDA